MNEQFTHIDLFSGIGGFALAARWTGFKTVVFCEKDEWCQKILTKNFGAVVQDTASKRRRSRRLERPRLQRTSPSIRASGIVAHTAGGKDNERGNMAETEGRREGMHTAADAGCPVIIPDIHDFDGSKWQGATLLTGGFPCQPFSCAGKRGGAADDRFLWPEMVRVIAEARPDWIIGENVRGIVSMELDRMLSDLEGIGYAWWPAIIPACAVDAKHRRDRVWIMAHAGHGSERQGRIQRQGKNKSPMGKGSSSKIERAGQDVADPDRTRQRERRRGESVQPEYPSPQHCCTWPDENEWFAKSGMGRVAHGVSDRVVKLKGLGNAVVPQVAAELMRMIMIIEKGMQ